jgi:hypothetical protein
MKISTVRKPNKQLWLFDVDDYRSTFMVDGSVNHGLVRTVIGTYYEEQTAKVFGGVVHKTDSRCDYCPDVSACNKFYEVKAVGNSGQAFIYAGRLVKDIKFAEQNDLYYCVWRHSVKTQLVSTVAELKAKLATSTLSYMVVPFSDVLMICRQSTLTKLNSKYGGSDSNPRYGSGYRIPVTKLAQCCIRSKEYEPP